MHFGPISELFLTYAEFLAPCADLACENAPELRGGRGCHVRNRPAKTSLHLQLLHLNLRCSPSNYSGVSSEPPGITEPTVKWISMKHIDYILTTFSPAMFGEGATAHIRLVADDEAQALVTPETRIVATRVSHEQLAKTCFPAASSETQRYAMLRPGVNAIHLHHRGPQVPDDGRMPVGAMVTYYLVETKAYQDLKAA